MLRWSQTLTSVKGKTGEEMAELTQVIHTMVRPLLAHRETCIMTLPYERYPDDI